MGKLKENFKELWTQSFQTLQEEQNKVNRQCFQRFGLDEESYVSCFLGVQDNFKEKYEKAKRIRDFIKLKGFYCLEAANSDK